MIYVTGDLFRLNPHTLDYGFQDQNIAFLYNLLKQTLFLTTDPDHIICRTSKDLSSIQSFKFQPSIEEWVNMVSSDKMLDDITPTLENLFPLASVIIGFELPKVVCSFCDLKEIPYLDFSIHPVRYCPDLFWAVKTNNSSFKNIVERFEITDSVFRSYASCIQARYSITSDFCISTPPPVRIFFAQTSIDRALCRNGRLFTTADFEENLAAWSKDAQEIWIKPHPLEPRENELTAFFSRLGRVKLLHNNPYEIFSPSLILIASP